MPSISILVLTTRGCVSGKNSLDSRRVSEKCHSLLWGHKELCVYDTHRLKCVAFCDFLVTKGILYLQSIFFVFPFSKFCFKFKLCLCEFFTRDVVHVGKCFFPGFSLFFRPWSRIVLLLKSYWLNHYMGAIKNPRHCEYGCALYVRCSI